MVENIVKVKLNGVAKITAKLALKSVLSHRQLMIIYICYHSMHL